MENSVFQKIENANKPDFGDILSRSFELFKKVWEQALYHVLITMAAVIPMILVIYLPYIIFVFYTVGFDSYSSYDPYGYSEPDLMQYLPLLILYILFVFVAIFIVQAFVLGITAHFYQVVKKIDMEDNTDVGGYFDLVKTDFKKLLLLSLASFGIAMLAVILCYLPIFYVMVPLQLVTAVYVFNRELSVRDIIRVCFKLGNKYWLIIFGLVILSSIIAQVGILLCFVGIFFTAYFVHLPMYYVYKDTIGFKEASEEKTWIVTS